MKENESLSPYEVFEGSAWEAGLLQSILTDNEIESILRDVTTYPWNTLPANISLAKLFVAYSDLDKANAIVEEFRINMKKENESINPEED
jgi:hypothetical protein